VDKGGLTNLTRKNREYRQAFKASLRNYEPISDYLQKRKYDPAGFKI